jgi:hypothetical protein
MARYVSLPRSVAQLQAEGGHSARSACDKRHRNRYAVIGFLI